MIIDKIRTVGELRRVIKYLSDDYEIEMRIRRKLSDDEIIELANRYPYPYETKYTELEFDGVGVSDKVLCLGVEIK